MAPGFKPRWSSSRAHAFFTPGCSQDRQAALWSLDTRRHLVLALKTHVLVLTESLYFLEPPCPLPVPFLCTSPAEACSLTPWGSVLPVLHLYRPSALPGALCLCFLQPDFPVSLAPALAGCFSCPSASVSSLSPSVSLSLPASFPSQHPLPSRSLPATLLFCLPLLFISWPHLLLQGTTKSIFVSVLAPCPPLCLRWDSQL